MDRRSFLRTLKAAVLGSAAAVALAEMRASAKPSVTVYCGWRYAYSGTTILGDCYDVYYYGCPNHVTDMRTIIYAC